MRYAWIETQRGIYSVSRLCRVLAVSRSGYCQWRGRRPSARSVANAALDAQVKAAYNASQSTYGRPRIIRTLRYKVTTDSDHALPVAANVLDRRFDGWAANEAWVGRLATE